MANATQAKTTIGQHLYGVAFLAGAILLVAAAFGLLLVAPAILTLDGVSHWRRGALDLFWLRNSWLVGLVVVAWLLAIAIFLLMSRADRLNRNFDRSFTLTLGRGDGRLESGSATAQDVAAHILRETAARATSFTFSDVIEEDYGAGFWASAGDDSFWVAVSALSDEIEKPQGRFAVNAGYDPGLSLLRRLRHRPDEERFKDLARAVGAAVRTLRPSRSRDA